MLVIWPPCGSKVSELAPACPFCGTPRDAEARSSFLPSARVSMVGGAPAGTDGSGEQPPASSPGGLLKPGDSIGSEFQVLKVLGEGGFGIVYLARSNRVGFCAVKTLRDELALDERVVDLFEKEARIWIALGRHPYIVRSHYVERVGGRFYIAMEYVPPNDRGVNDLEGYLRRQLPDNAQTLWWAIEFCHGMEYAYSKGVRCHRDIKPANILIGPDNRIRITDFGIAGVVVAKSVGVDPATGTVTEVANGDTENRTVQGAVFGTPSHMPPEQFLSAASCDIRSDIYSFGAVLFQMASGKLPFYPPPIAPGPDRMRKIWSAFAKMHREQPIPRIDSPLFPIIARCLEKDPAKRYGSFPELRADLEALLKQQTGETVALPSPQARQALDLANKGMSLAALGQPAEALRCYDEALQLDPRSAPTLNNKGNTLNKLGRREEAVACFDQAIAIDFKYAAPYLNKAISFVWLRRYPEAMQCLEQALSIEPRLVDAWTTKGLILDRMGKEAESRECYERALAIEPGDPIAWYNKAGQFHRKAQREEALECIERALHTDPRYVIAWMTKGVLLGDMGRHQEALQALERCLVLDPTSGKCWYNKGNVFSSLERYQEAVECFERGARLDPTFPVVWYNKALSEIKLQRYPEAQASLQQFLSLAPANDEFRAPAASMLQRLQSGEQVMLGRLNKGDTVLTRDAESDESVKVPVAPRPEAASRPGASPHAETASDTKQEELAKLQARLKDPNLSAAELFEIAKRVEELTPAAGEAMKQLFGVPSRKKEPSPAAPRTPGGDAAPPSPEECLKRATITHNQKQYDKALHWYDQALAAAPDNVKALASRGECLRCMGRFDEALSSLERALELDPLHHTAWLVRGYTFDALEQFDQAAMCYGNVLRMDPDNAGVWNLRGACLFAGGEVEEAIQCFNEALAKDSRFAIARFNKAGAEYKLGRRKEAAVSFQQFLGVAPPNLAAQIQIARARLAELRDA